MKLNTILSVSLVAAISFLSHPPASEASIIDSLCSSVAGFLSDEDVKADSAANNCRTNCGSARKKQKLVESARVKVNDSCAKGITPDMAQVSKGLDTATQDKLGRLYDQNSRMFDGTAALPVKDPGLSSSSRSPALTGKGGRVLDLKAADPDIEKTSPATDFSLEKKPAALATLVKTAILPQKASAADIPELPDPATDEEREETCAELSEMIVKQETERKAFILEIPALISNAEQKELLCKAQPQGCGTFSAAGVKASLEKSLQSMDNLIKRNSDYINKHCIVNKCLEGQVFTIAEKCELIAGKDGRSLTSVEKVMVKNIFGDKITDYKKIRIVTGKDRDMWGTIITLGLPEGSAVTSGYTIYFPGYSPDEKSDQATLLHEATHIYQREIYDGSGFIYWWKKLTERNGKYTLIADRSFNDYNFEQQAMIVRDYYFGWVTPLKNSDKHRELTPDEKALMESMLKDAELLK